VELKDKHKGEVIAILGNGPSLKEADKSLIATMTTIGINASPVFFDSDYLIMLDKTTVENRIKLVRRSRSIPFLPFPTGLLDEYHTYTNYQPRKHESQLSSDIKDGLRWSNTSIMPAINLAYVMGARAVILFGLDMNANNHFYKEKKKHVNDKYNVEFPNIETIYKDFVSVQHWIKEKNIDFTIFNANSNSFIRCFRFCKVSGQFLRKLIRRRYILKGCI